MRSEKPTTLWTVWLGVFASDKIPPEEPVAESEPYPKSTAPNKPAPPDLTADNSNIASATQTR